MRGSCVQCTAAHLQLHFIKDGDCSLWLSFGLSVHLFSSFPSFLLMQGHCSNLMMIKGERSISFYFNFVSRLVVVRQKKNKKAINLLQTGAVSSGVSMNQCWMDEWDLLYLQLKPSSVGLLNQENVINHSKVVANWEKCGNYFLCISCRSSCILCVKLIIRAT